MSRGTLDWEFDVRDEKGKEYCIDFYFRFQQIMLNLSEMDCFEERSFWYCLQDTYNFVHLQINISDASIFDLVLCLHKLLIMLILFVLLHLFNRLI